MIKRKKPQLENVGTAQSPLKYDGYFVVTRQNKSGFIDFLV